MLIAGGGTGGHIFPGIAIAREFLARSAGNQVLFVGTDTGLEKGIIPKEGFSLATIYIEGYTGRPLGRKIMSLLKLPLATAQALRILRGYRPDIVLGVGGYAAGPVLIAASPLRLPRIIQEQNLIPGLTNRLLGRIVHRIAISFAETSQYFPADRTVLTGNPIRRELFQPTAQQRGVSSPKGGESGRFTLLIIGGSRGAHQINRALIEGLDHLMWQRDSLYFLHQTGESDYLWVRDAYQEKGFLAQVFPFSLEMAEKYGQADLVICRAGATTLAELTALGKPAILIPYPFATHNHQYFNALALSRHGAAELIRSEELTGEGLAHRVTNLKDNPDRLREMGKRARELGRPEAASRIVDLCYRIIEAEGGGGPHGQAV